MQQLHRRKIHELQEYQADPGILESQVLELLKRKQEADAVCADSRINERLAELQSTLTKARAQELLTEYLLEFIPFANEEVEIQCEFAMKEKEARGHETQQFELSREKNLRLRDLTRRYKLQFWPQLASEVCDDDAPHQPLQMEDLYDVDGAPFVDIHRCTYKRINHFREYLRQQQGKSRVVIPPTVLEILRLELKKHHIPTEHCTPKVVRYLLKNLNQSFTRNQVRDTRRRYRGGGGGRGGRAGGRGSGNSGGSGGQFSWSVLYEHTPTITVLLNPDYKLVDIPSHHELELCRQFQKTEIPFEKYKLAVKKGRKNFLSYPYVTYKLCELFGWEQYLPAFSLLKSDDLLIQQDAYWKLICKDLHWQFVPTVGRVDMRETQAPPTQTDADMDVVSVM